MDFDKVTIQKITPRFELKVLTESDAGWFQGETLAFRGLNLPGPRSKKGRALREHLLKVTRSVPFLAVRKYEKNAFVRRSTEFFYLPGEDDPVRMVAAGRRPLDWKGN